MGEQNIVEKTRRILVENKGYPDPSECNKTDKNGLIMFAQDDYKNNSELKNLLKHSSKCSGKSMPLLWTDEAEYGKPEFIIINEEEELAIVIECKPIQKSNNHISPYMRDEKILVRKGNIISKYAVDGALHYAKFLSEKYNVIAIGISGINNSEDLNISTYYWQKDTQCISECKEIESSRKDEKTGKKIMETLDYSYGPFFDLNLDELCGYSFYLDFLNRESKEIIKTFSEKIAIDSSKELNVIFDGAGVNVTSRAMLVSGLLLALRDETFITIYEKKKIISNALQENLNQSIVRVIKNSDIEDEFKKNVLIDNYKAVFNQQKLLENNALKLREIIEILHKKIYPCMNGEYSTDIIGKFYHEFLSYAPAGQNNGIKLTPTQTTELFCDLIDLKVTDIIMDPCLGTGGFLISAMNKLYKLAENMTENDIDEYFKEQVTKNTIQEDQINQLKKRK